MDINVTDGQKKKEKKSKEMIRNKTKNKKIIRKEKKSKKMIR